MNFNLYCGRPNAFKIKQPNAELLFYLRFTPVSSSVFVVQNSDKRVSYTDQHRAHDDWIDFPLAALDSLYILRPKSVLVPTNACCHHGIRHRAGVMQNSTRIARFRAWRLVSQGEGYNCFISNIIIIAQDDDNNFHYDSHHLHSIDFHALSRN
jgi:hypothetical protein